MGAANSDEDVRDSLNALERELREEIDRAEGPDQHRVADSLFRGTPVEPVEEAVGALLERRVRADAISEVMRRPVDLLGGRSMLQASQDGDFEAVRAYVEVAFDLGRLQP